MFGSHSSASLKVFSGTGETTVIAVDKVYMLFFIEIKYQAGHQGRVGAMQPIHQLITTCTRGQHPVDIVGHDNHPRLTQNGRETIVNRLFRYSHVAHRMQFLLPTVASISASNPDGSELLLTNGIYINIHHIQPQLGAVIALFDS